MDNHHHGLEINPVLVSFFGVMAGAILVTICHCMIVICSSGTGMQRSNERQSNPTNDHEQLSRASGGAIDGTTVQVIVESEYSKECNEDMMCAVCLGEFKEGEGVRVLHECTHTFHVPCIDKWLNNHPNCPLCRANAIPPPSFQVDSLPNSGRDPAEGM